jgi:spore maturation protein CgeB
LAKIRIYKAFHTYQSYLDVFYSKNEQLKTASFNEQKKALINDGFPWIFTLSSNNFDETIEIFETVHNCEFLQKAWSDNFRDSEEWQINIILEQIKRYQPEICILYPPQYFNYEKLALIKNCIKHNVIIGGYDGMDRQNISLYNGYDFVITCSNYISRYYKSFGKLTYTLQFGFDETILKRINLNNKTQYNIGFSGSIYPNIHDQRYTLLKRISKTQRLAIRSEFATNINLNLFSKAFFKKILHDHDLEDFFGLWRVNRYNNGPVYGLEMFQFLRDCKISLNMHGDRVGFAANVRLYEITGVGSCMLTDWKENIHELFNPDKEIMTFSSVEEATDKSIFLLKNESIRRKIAQAGQERTLKEYTYNKTIPKLLTFLKSIN